MTTIEKVLLRKDTSSLIVAIVVGTATTFLLAGLSSPVMMWVGSLSVPAGMAPGQQWSVVWQSVLAFAVQVLLLELLLRAVIFGRSLVYKKSPGKK